MRYQPPHSVQDEAKVAAMIATLESSGDLPPVVVLPGGFQAITGSHRIEAWERSGRDHEGLELTEEQLATATRSVGFEPEDWDAMDWNDLCAAVYNTVDDEAVRSALADQRGH